MLIYQLRMLLRDYLIKMLIIQMFNSLFICLLLIIIILNNLLFLNLSYTKSTYKAIIIISLFNNI